MNLAQIDLFQYLSDSDENSDEDDDGEKHNSHHDMQEIEQVDPRGQPEIEEIIQPIVTTEDAGSDAIQVPVIQESENEQAPQYPENRETAARELQDEIEDLQHEGDESQNEASTDVVEPSESEETGDVELPNQQLYRRGIRGGFYDEPEFRRIPKVLKKLDDCFDPQNFDPSYPDQPKDETVMQAFLNKKENITTNWTYKPQNQPRKREACNVMRTPAHVVREPFCGESFRNIEDVFEIFMPKEIRDHICLKTNCKLARVLRRLPPEIRANEKYTWFHKRVDDDELKALFGLMYARGLMNWGYRDVTLIWGNDCWTSPLFGATMSRCRFQLLLRLLSFDDKRSRAERRKKDKFAAIREVFEDVVKIFPKVITSDEWNTIDETLYPTKGRISFRCFNKDKPKKYGIKFQSLNTVNVPYCLATRVYSGQPNEPDEYYKTGPDEEVKDLVSRAKAGNCSLKGKHLTYDNYYASYSTHVYLKEEEQITALGTWRKNRGGIPEEAKTIEGRNANSTIVFYNVENPSITVTSYVAKTSKGKKSVLMLSSVDHYQGTLKESRLDNSRRPAINCLYNFTKIGTDVCDQKMRKISTAASTNRWPMTVLYYLLDSIAVNSITVASLNNKIHPRNSNTHKMMDQLIKALTVPYIRNRSLNGLNYDTQSKIKIVLGENLSPHIPEIRGFDFPRKCDEKDKARCRRCLESITGKDFTRIRNSIGRKRHRCQNCNTPVCDIEENRHCVLICVECASAINVNPLADENEDSE